MCEFRGKACFAIALSVAVAVAVVSRQNMSTGSIARSRARRTVVADGCEGKCVGVALSPCVPGIARTLEGWKGDCEVFEFEGQRLG